MNSEITKYKIDFFNIESKAINQYELVIKEGRHSENKNVTWNCKFEFEGINIAIQDEYFLSGVMRKIREIIEPIGFRALVVCSEKNSSHSGMQADMTNGTMIYKLESEKNGSLKSFHVFEKSTIELAVSIQEQDDFAKNFYSELRNKNTKTIPWYKKIYKK